MSFMLLSRELLSINAALRFSDKWRHPLTRQRATHSLSVEASEEDPRPGPPAEHRGEALRLGADPLLDELTTLSENASLSFPLVDVDANMVHGRPLLSAALTACCSRGAVYATTSSERRAASSDLSSALPVEGGADGTPA